jgi:uncharacterized iron-regulated membrane protein
MKAITFKTFERVHSWTGLLAGLALFIAFYAGAFTMFHEQTEHWQSPSHAVESRKRAWADAQALVASVTKQYPEARAEVGLTLPHGDSNEVQAWWFDGKVWQYRTPEQMRSLAPAAAASGSEESTDLAHFIYGLHYSLGIPTFGIYLMGVVSIIYGLALVTGVILYLPSFTKDLFALRAGRNLKRLWKDAHNVIGVLSLPFHVMFAITGAIFCLASVLVAALNVVVFKGELVDAFGRATGFSEVVQPRGLPAASMLTPQAAVERAREAVQQKGGKKFDAAYVRYKQYGDEAAVVEAMGDSDGALASYGGVAMSAVDGRVLNMQAAGARDMNHATYSTLFGLHFGHYGKLTLRWVYFVLGLSGAFLFYSGNLLWVESRRNRRGTTQTRGSFVMARATVGVCLGTCLGVSATFIATLVAAAFGQKSNGIVAPVYFTVLAVSVAWAFYRMPARAAADLLTASAIATAAVPVIELALVALGLRPSFFAAGSVSLALAVVALLLAMGFGLLARATARRAANGDPNSVWTGARPRMRTQPTPRVLEASPENH